MMFTLLCQIIYYIHSTVYNCILLVKVTNYQFYSDILCSIDIDNREIWRLIRKVLIELHTDLPDLLKPSIADLDKEMYEVGLINHDVLKRPTYHVMIGDFLTGINFMKSHNELQENMKNFLMI